MRAMRASCDACRLRKVACDREARMEKGEATCSACARFAITCTSTRRHQRVTRQDKPGIETPFGVRGLSLSIVDLCVHAYLRFMAPCVPIVDISSLMSRTIQYETDVLVLAMAAMGAPLLDATTGPARFALQLAMERRFVEMLSERPLAARTLEEQADVIEATFILSDLKRSASQEEGPLRMGSSSFEFITRLVLDTHMNREPLDVDGQRYDSSTGVALSATQVQRRSRIFWFALMQDSFRSFGRQKSTVIRESDYDWELPQWMLHPESHYDAPVHLVPREALSTMASFDAAHLESFLRLAFLVRTISIKFVTPEAQGRGVRPTEVERALYAFEQWRHQLPSIITWESAVQHPPLHDDVCQRNSIKALFLESLFLRQIAGTWSALHEYGVRADECHCHCHAPSSRGRLDELMTAALFRIAKLHTEAAARRLLRAHRVLLDLSATYALFGCALLRHMPPGGHVHVPSDAKLGPFAVAAGDMLTAEDMARLVQQLIDAARTCDSSQYVGEVVTKLQRFLAEARSVHRPLSSSDSAPFSSTSSSTSSPFPASPVPSTSTIYGTFKATQTQMMQWIDDVKVAAGDGGVQCHLPPLPPQKHTTWQASLRALNDELPGNVLFMGPDARVWASDLWNNTPDLSCSSSIPARTAHTAADGT